MDVLSLNLPPGFRFSPTEEELINCFLRPKINGNDKQVFFIPEVHFFKWEPWELPDLSGLKTKDLEWFFFSPQDLKHQNGNRLNRATNAGYWKVTGKDQEIKSEASLIGKKKILVFYKGRMPTGEKTDWVMHEYHMAPGTNPCQNTFVLCRLFDKHKKSVKGPKLNKHGSAVSSPTSSKSSLEVAKSKLAVASEQAEDYPTIDECFDAKDSDRTAYDSRAPVEGGDNNINASTAENQVAQVNQVIDTEFDLQVEEELQMLSALLQNPLDYNPLTPLTSLLNAPAVSSPTPAKSSPEEAEFKYTAKDPVAEVTTGEVEVDLNMSYVPPEPLDWSSLSPLHLQMQNEFGPFCMSDPVTNDLNNDHGVVCFQYGTNEGDAYISQFWDSVPTDRDEYFHNYASSQKNLDFYGETWKHKTPPKTH